MANHYYSENPETAHDLHQWSFELAGRNFQFVTDSGVFSRDTVDYGSRVLIEHFDAEELPEEHCWMLARLWSNRYGIGLSDWAFSRNDRRE